MYRKWCCSFDFAQLPFQLNCSLNEPEGNKKHNPAPAGFLFAWHNKVFCKLGDYREQNTMRSTLQDQLLKAGLVDEKTVKQAKKEKQSQQQKVAKNQRHIETDEAKLLAQKAMAEKQERDRLLNQQQNEHMMQRAIAAQIRQLIETHRQPRGDSSVAYNFTDGKLIKKILVSQLLVDQIQRGQLAIVRLDDKYELIPARAAEKIRERDANCVVVCNSPQHNTANDDDPYADFQIPDDLMW